MKERLVNQLDERIGLWLRKKKQSTRLQYAAHVGQLRSMLKRRQKSLDTATRTDIVDYIRTYHSFWARKRALVAIRSCYKFLSKTQGSPIQNIAQSINLRSIEMDAHSVELDAQLCLFDAGWRKQRLNKLTWKTLVGLISEDTDLPEAARDALYKFTMKRLVGRRRVVRDCLVFPGGIIEENAS
jgi:Phage integrase, N-terminal SAM-like domain